MCLVIKADIQLKTSSKKRYILTCKCQRITIMSLAMDPSENFHFMFAFLECIQKEHKLLGDTVVDQACLYRVSRLPKQSFNNQLSHCQCQSYLTGWVSCHSTYFRRLLPLFFRERRWKLSVDEILCGDSEGKLIFRKSLKVGRRRRHRKLQKRRQLQQRRRRRRQL